MKNTKCRTVVLTSRENFVWTSMQEIIPSLENLWLNGQTSKEYKVDCFIIEEFPFSKILPYILQADNLVFTCFTVKLSQMAKLIRETLSIQIRYIIHLHSLATIGCWPMYKWGMGNVLQDTDIFISTCTRDQNCLKISFKNTCSELIPFSNSDQEHVESFNPKNLVTKDIKLCYVGRISSQKNIHALLFSIYLLLKNRSNLPTFHLEIFGGEDNLGSPNMELYRSGYLKYLNQLIDELNLTKHVTFMGFIERSQLRQNHLNRPHILLSPSLHSDENFGISVLKSLLSGNLAILTDWGGHTDYLKYFKDQVNLVPVYKSKMGPFINPYEFANKIEEQLLNFKLINKPIVPSYYSKREITNKLKTISLSPTPTETNSITLSDISTQLLEKREQFLEQNLISLDDTLERRIGCKIFENYADCNAIAFFESYGMENTYTYKDNAAIAIIPPWVKMQNNKFIISDYHRGDFEVTSLDGDLSLVDCNEKTTSVSKHVFDSLIQMGYAFPISK